LETTLPLKLLNKLDAHFEPVSTTAWYLDENII
jgi:hypothetical protein